MVYKDSPSPHSPVYLDSCFSRILYYFYQSTSIISCLHIVFSQHRINNSFALLLSKHRLNLSLLAVNHWLLVIIKVYICSAFSILFILIAETICQTTFSIFSVGMNLGNNDVTIIVSGFICLLSLSALTFIIV